VADPPSGTVTFLFTDIEGSTRAWERDRATMATALTRHDAILREAIEKQRGYVFKTVGDAFCAAFARAPDALAAAVGAQRTLAAEPWGGGPVRVRMAVHAGSAEERAGDYFGPAVNRVARLLSTGHGGQVLLSLAAQELVRDELPSGVRLRDLGDHRLKDLERPERIFQVVAPDLPDRFPSLSSLAAHPTNLPIQLTPFVGRAREVAAVRDLLIGPDARLLTLTGPGGTGKTRLALQAAAEASEAFPDGVFTVLLAAIRDPAFVAPAIAAALGVREGPEQAIEQRLGEFLEGKRLLLVLDNFEQVEDAAPLVVDILRSAPTVTILVTSRVALRVSGEREFAVPPLDLPEAAVSSPDRVVDCEAVRLFAARARAVRPDFAVTEHNAQVCAEICRRLDGLPLAIELAAARLKLLPPQALLDRLARTLPLLTGGSRDLPARQRTLRGAIAWSHDLLGPEERALFRRCAVFAGGWTLEAAEAVGNAGDDLGADVFDELTRLADHSLLRPPAEADGEPRLGMLETVREFALEQLAASGEEGATRRRHAAHFLALAEASDAELKGPRQAEALERLAAEHDNLRVALGWALGGSPSLPGADPALGLRLAGALRRFWEVRGHLAEGRGWLELALAETRSSDAEPQSTARATALQGAGTLALRQGDYARAAACLEEAIAAWGALGDRAGVASALTGLADVAERRGEYGWATALLEEALGEARAVHDPAGVARVLTNLGNVAERREDFARAEALYDEALAANRAAGDRRGVAICLNNLGLLAYYRRDYLRAAALHEDVLGIFRALGDPHGAATSLNNLGLVAQDRGDPSGATRFYEEALQLRREIGDRWGVLRCLTNLGTVAQERGDHARAEGLFTEALDVARSLAAKAEVANVLTNLGRDAREQRRPDRARALFEEAIAHWREVGQDSMLALALVGLGDVLRDRGEVAEPARLYREAVHPWTERGHLGGIAGLLERYAALALAAGAADRAGALIGASDVLREQVGGRPSVPDDAEREQIVAAVKAALGEAAFAEGRERGRARSTEEAVAEALALADELAAGLDRPNP
jgi:predicted ATPase/class 3 adenylate cyclase/Tfp pilus assembly protein PilF